MDSYLRRSLSRNRRALDFATAHPIADAGFKAVFTRLQQVVTSADTLAVQQTDGTIGESAARKQRRDLGREVRATYLVRLVRVAAKAAQTDPTLAGKFVLPSRNLPIHEFLTAAQQLLDAATPLKDTFTALGIGDQFFDELSAAIQQLSGVSESVHGGRDGHVVARAELENGAREANSEIRILETFYRRAASDDPDLLQGWKAAARVRTVRHPAPDAPPAPMPEPKPA